MNATLLYSCFGGRRNELHSQYETEVDHMNSVREKERKKNVTLKNILHFSHIFFILWPVDFVMVGGPLLQISLRWQKSVCQVSSASYCLREQLTRWPSQNDLVTQGKGSHCGVQWRAAVCLVWRFQESQSQLSECCDKLCSRLYNEHKGGFPGYVAVPTRIPKIYTLG